MWCVGGVMADGLLPRIVPIFGLNRDEEDSQMTNRYRFREHSRAAMRFVCKR